MPNTFDNRTGIEIGTSTGVSLLACTAEHIGMSNSIPAVVWTRNGNEVVDDNDHKIDTDPTSGLFSTLEISNFAESDVGEYQCIFIIDNDTVIMSKPYRLDTGELKQLR